MNKKNDFSLGEIRSVMVRTAVPIMIAQTVSLLYNIVDRIYIGHMALESSSALSGIGICMPIILLLNGFANLVGLGGAPLCSIARGRGDLRHAERLMGNSLTLLLLISITLTVLLSLLLRPLLYAFGASDVSYPYAAGYLRIYALGSVFAMVSLGMNAFINAQGFSRMGMVTTLIGAVLNLVLDPIFIFVLGMGVEGAAIATVISQFFSALWVLSFLRSSAAILKLRRADLRLKRGIVASILKMGISPLMTNATSSFVQILENVQLLHYGGDLYVSAMTVISSINQLFLTLPQGFAMGTQPVLGFNYGARKPERLRRGIRFEALLCGGFMFASTFVLLGIPAPLVRLFNSDALLLSAAVHSMRLYFACFGFMAFQLVGNSVLQAFGKARLAIVFSLLRKVILVTPLALLLPGPLGLGTDGIFAAEAISMIIGGPCCFLTMYFTQYRHLDRIQKTID